MSMSTTSWTPQPLSADEEERLARQDALVAMTLAAAQRPQTSAWDARGMTSIDQRQMRWS